MTRGKDEFCLVRDDSVAFKLNFVSASLFVKKVPVSLGVRLGHAQALLSTTAKYPVERVCLKNFSIPPGSLVSNQENIFLSTQPKSIILAMTENSAFSEVYDKKPFAFKHFNQEFLALYRDGVQIPSKPLQPEYENGSAVNDFYQLVLSTKGILKINLWQQIGRIFSKDISSTGLIYHPTKTFLITYR